MSNLKNFMNEWGTRIKGIKSEEEAKKLFSQMNPQINEFTEKLFARNDFDFAKIEIDWISEISEYIINTIELYLLYHIKGELNHIRLSLSEINPPLIILTIDQKEYIVDFSTFKSGTNENNRDAHRECYYRNESIWNEYRRMGTDFDIRDAGEGICSKLRTCFSRAVVDFIIL